MFQLFGHVLDPEYIELIEWLDERVLEELEQVENEALQPLVLEHVGIADINRCFSVLSQKLKDDISYVYSLSGGGQLQPVISELRKFLFEKLNITHGDIYSQTRPGNSPDDFNSFGKLQNLLYPVVGGGFIEDIANTALWRRTLGIPQLGWKDNYPVENVHSRGAHELFLTVNMVRIIQSLYEKCPEALLTRLRKDFVGLDFYDANFSDEEVVKLAADLAVVVGMTHDIYTPAGGDMMKHVMGMDEEADASKMLEDGDERVEELRKVLENRGIWRSHIDFVVNCIQGDSSSLVGEMIHVPEGDCLDQDRLAYTFQDLYSIGGLAIALPSILFNEKSLENSTATIESTIANIVELLNDPYMHAMGPAYTGGHPVSMSLLDVSDDYILDDKLHLACLSPDKLAAIAWIRATLMREFYQGTKLRGQERDMSFILEEMHESREASSVLEANNLLSVNNRGLEEQLRSLGNTALNGLLDRINKSFFDIKYDSKIVDAHDPTDNDWYELQFSIKAGLDTPVMDNQEVKTLEEYMKDHADDTFCRLLSDANENFKDKKRVINKINESEDQTRMTWLFV